MFERLVVAVDDSASGPIAVSFTAALARTHGAEVRVVHVNPFVRGGRGQTAQTASEARNLVARFVRELRESGVVATGLVCRATRGDVGDRLADVAEEWRADAVVVGSRRLDRLGRLRGRGLREQVVRRSQLPVLTAPAPLAIEGRIPAAMPVPTATPAAR